jgi:carbohydrate-binding DOMON domain-containing protein
MIAITSVLFQVSAKICTGGTVSTTDASALFTARLTPSCCSMLGEQQELKIGQITLTLNAGD